jgi:glycogen operon protein
MTEEDWTHPFFRSIGFLSAGDAIATTDPYGNKVVGDTLLILMNAHHEPVEFVLPAIEWGSDWEILVNTADGDGKTGALTPAGWQAHRRGPRDDGASPPGAHRPSGNG